MQQTQPTNNCKKFVPIEQCDIQTTHIEYSKHLGQQEQPLQPQTPTTYAITTTADHTITHEHEQRLSTP